jgi:hypothetical protein
MIWLLSDEFSKERGGDVERQVADQSEDAFPKGSGDFFEISLENILPDEGNILNPLLKKASLPGFRPAGDPFLSQSRDGRRIGEGHGQSPEARSDFNDR